MPIYQSHLLTSKIELTSTRNGPIGDSFGIGSFILLMRTVGGFILCARELKLASPIFGPAKVTQKTLYPEKVNMSWRISKESTYPCFSTRDWQRSPLRPQDCAQQQRISCRCRIRSQSRAAVFCNSNIVSEIRDVF